MGGRDAGVMRGGISGTVHSVQAVVVLAMMVGVGASNISATDVSSEDTGKSPRVPNTESAICELAGSQQLDVPKVT